MPASYVNLRAVDNSNIQPGDEDVLLANVTFVAEAREKVTFPSLSNAWMMTQAVI
ncbi:hypothetical protein [Methanosarcina horonobensis]|uniref:hypothetical protein n=1 Tax=Methanosarcina horonobensis TaxID=418008 RepID=UPI0022B9237C|nr:hypothetical protein [Methanosarcina horonobensis]